MHPSRFIPVVVAGSILWMLSAVAFCQDARIRALVQSLGSEEFKDRAKAQRDLVEWAQAQPERAVDWLLREHDAAVEPEIDDIGDVQVTTYGTGSTQCRAVELIYDGVVVNCFGPDGIFRDSRFMVLLHS